MSAQDTKRLTSLLHRIFWDNYRDITGKAFVMDDINDPRLLRLRDLMVKKYLPEMRKIQGKAAK